jgi:predicted AAA+ superfamily ATPase
MKYIPRIIEKPLKDSLGRGKSVLLLGARQTGKTTLLKHLELGDLSYTLLDPELRLRLEKSPNLLGQEIAAFKRLNHLDRTPIVIIDEVQKIPALMDAIQLLIDNREAQFILTGSSVRKLRRHSQFNLLPGRVINFHLDPLCLLELPQPLQDISSLLLFGSLPDIYLENNIQTKEADLQAYVKNYLEEEVRGEALVRQLGSFARFIELAAVESGNQININKLSQELGISRYTIADYFLILEDCLIAEKIEPVTLVTSRRKLTKAPKYLFFDMGIRRIAALEGAQLSSKAMGDLFEQYIGLELSRILRVLAPTTKLRYWRDHAGPEVDYVLENNKKYTPVEIKWTSTPTIHDAKHLIKFMQEYDCTQYGYIVCRCEKPLLLQDNILAMPWQELGALI